MTNDNDALPQPLNDGSQPIAEAPQPAAATTTATQFNAYLAANGVVP